MKWGRDSYQAKNMNPIPSQRARMWCVAGGTKCDLTIGWSDRGVASSERVDDWDKSASLVVGAIPRRSASSLDGMIDDTAKFETDGFAIIPSVASPAQCDAAMAQAGLAASHAPGSRTLLSMPWCAALADA